MFKLCIRLAMLLSHAVYVSLQSIRVLNMVQLYSKPVTYPIQSMLLHTMSAVVVLCACHCISSSTCSSCTAQPFASSSAFYFYTVHLSDHVAVTCCVLPLLHQGAKHGQAVRQSRHPPPFSPCCYISTSAHVVRCIVLLQSIKALNMVKLYGKAVTNPHLIHVVA
jgi:hypothetical protein